MKKLNINYIIKIICCGFIALLIWTVLLYWGRFIFESALLEIMPREAKRVSIRPSGLIPEKYENDPNVVIHSGLEARMSSYVPQFLGHSKNFFPGIDARRSPMYNNASNIYKYEMYSNGNVQLIYFDEDTGLIRYRLILIEDEHDKVTAREYVDYYIGPDGMSQRPGKELGRFFKPIAGPYHDKWLIFDKKLQRFFKISLGDKKVLKGPELAKDGSHQPVQIVSLSKNWRHSYIYFQAPQVKNEKEDQMRERVQYKPIINIAGWGPYALVLDRTGKIDLLDKETLKFAGLAGRLPAPYELFGSREKVKIEELLCYRAEPYFLYIDRDNWEYLGLAAAAVNREGTALSLVVYNNKGAPIERRDTRLGRDTPKFYDYAEHYQLVAPAGPPTSEAVYFNSPWAPAFTIGKYLLENLQPFGLNVVSYFTAELIEAESGHLALFVVPNSFIAMKARETTDKILSKAIGAWLLIFPSLILSLLLAWRINNNTNLMGFSEQLRLYWIIGTVALGLPAYITYHLTKPKIKQVTCENCGRMRRPDMKLCQHCGSKWQIPELKPPEWRVIGEKS